MHTSTWGLLAVCGLMLLGISACGVAYDKSLETFEYRGELPLPDHFNPDAPDAREIVLAAARKKPKEALISFHFYRIAKIQEVQEILTLAGGRAETLTIRRTESVPHPGELGGQPLLTLVPQVLFIPGNTTLASYQVAPLSIALFCNQSPEVLQLLLDAGAETKGWMEWFTRKLPWEKTRNMTDARILEVLLDNLPITEDEAFDLAYLTICLAPDRPQFLAVLLRRWPYLRLDRPGPYTSKLTGNTGASPLEEIRDHHPEMKKLVTDHIATLPPPTQQ